METKAPRRLGKGCLCLRPKALGNNNQELSLGNRHSNIETQVGRRCFPAEVGGRLPPRGASRVSSLQSLNPDREKAEPGGKESWVYTAKEGALPAAIEPCLAAEISEAKVTPPARPDPWHSLPAPSEGAGCSARLLLGTPPSLAASSLDASQRLGANSAWKEENAGFSAPAQAAGRWRWWLCALLRRDVGSSPAPAPPRCRWAAAKRGALALLALAPATSLPPELLSLHKYAFNNQAVFV